MTHSIQVSTTVISGQTESQTHETSAANLRKTDSPQYTCSDDIFQGIYMPQGRNITNLHAYHKSF